MKKTNYVDTIIGTIGDEKSQSLHGGGKTYPGVCLPGGMVQLSPDTYSGGDNTAGYNYLNNTIEGFSFNHMSGVGWYGDLGNIQLMPVVGKTDLRSGSNDELPFLKGTEGWKSIFSHDIEITKPGYYAVELERYGIYTELTASTHTGYLRLTYKEMENSGILFNFARRIGGKVDYQNIKIVNANEIEGHLKCTPLGGGWGRGLGKVTYDLYFTIQFSVPMVSYTFFSNEEYLSATDECDGEDVGLDVRFYLPDDGTLIVRCGISYVDLDGAKNNLATEGIGFDFDVMHQRADAEWEKALGCIEVEGDDETDLTIFYSCLYHVLLDPRTLQDVDNRFRCADHEICQGGEYTQRTIFSGWDIYRSAFPLLTIINPEIINDTINSLLKIAEIENSSLPRYELMGTGNDCMVGDPGLIVSADAYVKGIANFDVQRLYEICRASSMMDLEFEGKPFKSNRLLELHRDIYLKDAYVPNCLSSTLELLIADYTMAILAKAVKKNDDAEYFIHRAMRYAENYNSDTGFMGPRNEKNNFVHTDGRFDEVGCVEANIYQQSWAVPYDICGLFDLFGRERAITLLEELFEGADLSALWNEYYNHSNEPCHNLTHYFNYVGLERRCQYWTRRVQKEAYRKGPFGFCGNEDVGQISGWYVLSALGFAQVCPADKTYQINTPLFKKCTIKLDKKYHKRAVSDTFTVECDNNPLEYPYIKKLYLNDKELDRMSISYDDITSGGILRVMLTK